LLTAHTLPYAVLVNRYVMFDIDRGWGFDVEMEMSPRYEPRTTSILSADVVDYSRSIAIDAVRTVTVLGACRDIIGEFVSEHGGRIFGSAGDSFMIEFADPTEALRCAVAMQRALRQRNRRVQDAHRMWFRTGVNIGEVIEESNGVLHGQSVNIAVRLQEACPIGGVVVSSLLRSRIDDAAEFRFRSLGELPFKNIQTPIEVLEVVVPEADTAERAPASTIVDLEEPVPGFSGRPALAVLPFENVTRDARLDYLSDGLSEELTTRLSHLRWFPIIDRNSSFAFRGATIGAREIGRRLGARYLLEGSVRVAGDRLRVTARLVDSEADHTFWSNDYDVRLPDLVYMLEEVAKCIIATLEGRMEEAEEARARGRRRSRLDTWGIIWRGRWHLNRLNNADAEEARRLFAEAVGQDPQSAEALIHLTWWTWYDVWSQRRPRDQILAFRDLALRAVEADELDSRGHLLAGCAEILLRDPDQALGHLDRAIRLNPSLAYAHAQIGSSHMLAGRPRDAIAPLKTSLRLNPQDHYVFYVLGELAAVHYMLGEWDEALQLADKSLSLRPAYWHARMTKIGALSRRGGQAVAAAEREILFRQHRKFSREFIEWLPFEDRGWIDYFAEGVLQAKGGKS